MKKQIFVLGLVVLTLLFYIPFEAKGEVGDFYSHTDGKKDDIQQKEIENTILEALEQLKKGEKEEALTLLAEAMMMIKSGEELSLLKVALCTEIGGYRDFAEKQEKSLKTNEPLLLYIEPAGYQIKKENGEYTIWVSEDASIVNESGQVIFQKTDWVEYRKGFMSPVIPFFITNRVTDIPPGKYTFKFTLKDHYKNSFLSESLEFIVE